MACLFEGHATEGNVVYDDLFAPPQGQIRNYRKIYDELYKKVQDEGIKNFHYVHTPGLFPILEKAFALAARALPQTISTENYKYKEKNAKETFNNLYSLAQKINSEGEMCPLYFNKINFYLAHIVELDNVKYDDMESKIKNYDYQIDARLFYVEKEAQDVEFRPFFTLYTSKGIAPTTFVEQYSDFDYPASLGVFDVNQGEAQLFYGTKKDPHWSFFNGLGKLYRHDMNHAWEQLLLMEKNINIPWYHYLRLVNGIRKTYKASENNYKVLTNGLFVLSHELANVSGFMVGNPSMTFRERIADITDYMRRETDKLKQGYEQVTYYKRNGRDWEFILKNVKDAEENSFLPMVQIGTRKTKTGKHIPITKFLSVVRSSNGTSFLIEKEQNNNTLHLINMETQESSYLPYSKDSCGSVLLPNGFSWVPLQERKELDRRLQKFRRHHAADLLANGYKNFWNYFLDLIKDMKELSLHHAVANNAMDVINALISKGANINAPDNAGQTPLHHAATHNAEDAANALIKAGADIDARANNGKTPLDLAREYNNQDVIRILEEQSTKQNRPQGNNNQNEIKIILNDPELSEELSITQSRQQVENEVNIVEAEQNPSIRQMHKRNLLNLLQTLQDYKSIPEDKRPAFKTKRMPVIEENVRRLNKQLGYPENQGLDN